MGIELWVSSRSMASTSWTKNIYKCYIKYSYHKTLQSTLCEKGMKYDVMILNKNCDRMTSW